MMLRILRDKLVRLGKGEDGAALIVTLALFMFMYLSCAGVFTVGQLVKDRIHLQNACDAAAYSAAVVQADTLSRIATINRAMAWTYISMSRRQMDYIVWKWLTETVKLVREDVDKAKASGSPGNLAHRHNYWSLKPSSPSSFYCDYWDDWTDDEVEISLNGTHSPVKPKDIHSENQTFVGSHFNDESESFYNGAGSGIGVLKSQIDADKETIRKMYQEEKSLAESLPGMVKDAVKNVLRANACKGRDLRYALFQCKTPYVEGGSGESYLEVLDSSYELRFLGFADYFPSDQDRPFEKGSGSGEWFPLSDGEGFLRKYRQRSPLYSAWGWRSWIWHCPHHDSCYYTDGSSDSQHYEARSCHDQYFDGEAAKPLVLKEEYFSGTGSITVGLACYNENPWCRIFGASTGMAKGILDGIYGAFNPYRDVEWTWAFSSAKAGYKLVRSDTDYEGGNDGIGSRSYMVHWNDDRQWWNLCQSDWDAVFVPVRSAANSSSKATGSGEEGDEGRSWSYGDDSSFKDWIVDGDWQPVEASGSSTTYAVASMPNLPGMNDNSGAIKNLNWKRLADMLYH